ncbi:SDR family oxidoreductase [Nocardiopsis mangrovi]|uniref:SDR family oxidoreductase n=1 Tax=Nocardiopsis mangrovi TaxID=1179818 RepID=A0ABV9E4S8_9ACTN
MSGPGGYAGKNAVVIGGTHGMGRGVVDALLNGGARTLLTGYDERNIESVRGTLGAAVHAVRSDIASPADIDALGDLVEAEFGTVDLLLVNAGVASIETLEEVTEASYDRTFDVNTKGAFFTVQRLAPLVADGGAIVFSTSVANSMGYPGMSAYSGAKAAVASFARSFAAELLPRNIRVYAVSGGYIDTPTMAVASWTDAERAAFKKEGDATTPMRRHGTVEEFAAAVLFLAFEATFTTGIEFPVDGGLGQGIMAGT